MMNILLMSKQFRFLIILLIAFPALVFVGIMFPTLSAGVSGNVLNNASLSENIDGWTSAGGIEASWDQEGYQGELRVGTETMVAEGGALKLVKPPNSIDSGSGQPLAVEEPAVVTGDAGTPQENVQSTEVPVSQDSAGQAAAENSVPADSANQAVDNSQPVDSLDQSAVDNSLPVESANPAGSNGGPVPETADVSAGGQATGNELIGSDNAGQVAVDSGSTVNSVEAPVSQDSVAQAPDNGQPVDGVDQAVADQSLPVDSVNPAGNDGGQAQETADVSAGGQATGESSGSGSTTDYGYVTGYLYQDFTVTEENARVTLSFAWKTGDSLPGEQIAQVRIVTPNSGPVTIWESSSGNVPNSWNLVENLDIGSIANTRGRYQIQLAANFTGSEMYAAFDEIHLIVIPRDTRPPSTPGLLQVKDLKTGGKLRLSWEKPNDRDLAGYRIFRSSDAKEPFFKIAEISGNEQIFFEMGLTDGMDYYYQIVAFDYWDNQSELSPVAIGIPTLDITPPGPPQGLEVKMNKSGKKVKVSWEPNGEYDLAGYYVYRSTSSDGYYARIAEIDNFGRTAYEDWDVEQGVAYFYKVQAFDDVANLSPSGGVASIAPVFEEPSFAREIKPSGEGEIGLMGVRGVDRTSRGFLISDTFNRRLLETDNSGKLLWSFELTARSEPQFAKFISKDEILYIDPPLNRVAIINKKQNEIVWAFNDLLGPEDAVADKNGHIYITDSGNSRIIKVDRDSGEILWQFGETRQPGNGNKLLDRPVGLQLLGNGNLIVADSGNNRVVEVELSSNSVVWEYGGAEGTAYYELDGPHYAYRTKNGNTLITDTFNYRLLLVGRDSRTIWQYGASGKTEYLFEPFQAITGNGREIVVADQHNNRIAVINY